MCLFCNNRVYDYLKSNKAILFTNSHIVKHPLISNALTLGQRGNDLQLVQANEKNMIQLICVFPKLARQ